MNFFSKKDKEAEKTASRAGFTIVELLIVITISALMSGLVIVSSRNGQSQLAASVQASKIAELILQAKALSVATYSTVRPGGAAVCAYGVDVNYVKATFSIFAYVPSPSAICPTYASTTVAGMIPDQRKQYSQGSWNVPLAQGVRFETSSTLRDVIFYPPDPTTLISHDGMTFDTSSLATSYIYLTSPDGTYTSQVSVSPAGQVQN